MPRILVLAPFFGAEPRWIDEHCGRADFEFHKPAHPLHAASWHQRGGSTSLAEWGRHLRYAHASMRWRCDLIVTSFPQLALVAAALLSLRGRARPRLLAWNFNVGSLASAAKGRLAGSVLARVDRFVVHAREEITSYARWLGIAEDRFRFVPLHTAAARPSGPSPIAGRYVVSMGSANRDYPTLVAAVLAAGIRTVIVSKRSLLDALPDHPDLVKLHGLSQEECQRILASAELSVVPIAATDTASGQVTFITSMRMGIPTIATRCMSSVDYIRDGVSGLLVPPRDAAALRKAIESLRQDAALRGRIAAAGRAEAEERFSEAAAGRSLAAMIDELLAARRPDAAPG